MTTTRRRTRLALVGIVAAQRLAELVWSRRNEARLRARGAVEHDREGYPAMVALHVAWLTSMAVETSWVPLASRPWRRLGLVGLLAAQPLRYWAIGALGDRWTTRVLVPPEEAPVETGPYRFLAHPNYVAVAVEIATVPLAIGAWRTAAFASGLDALVLRRRIAVESSAVRRGWSGDAYRADPSGTRSEFGLTAPTERSDMATEGQPRGTDSRVEDWYGQSVERDAELADRLTEDDELDEQTARRRFEEEATGESEQDARHGERIDPDQGRSAYDADQPDPAERNKQR